MIATHGLIEEHAIAASIAQVYENEKKCRCSEERKSKHTRTYHKHSSLGEQGTTKTKKNHFLEFCFVFKKKKLFTCPIFLCFLT